MADMSRAGSFSEGVHDDPKVRRPGETNSQYNMRQPEFRALHELGDCKDCGRNEGHKWHRPGHATLGDGSQPHVYNPTGGPRKSLVTSSDEVPPGARLD